MVKRYLKDRKSNVQHSEFDERYLTLAEVQECIDALEKHYGFSRSEFESSDTRRKSLSEDEFLEWEMCIEDAAALERIEEENRRAYVNMLRSPLSRRNSTNVDCPRNEAELMIAA